MHLADIQKRIDQWIGLFEEGYFPPLSNLARLTEEVGELARAINHRFGAKTPKPHERDTHIEEELGDILFTTAVIANSLHIDLEKVMRATLDKVIDRDSTRWTIKEGASLRDAYALSSDDDAPPAKSS